MQLIHISEVLNMALGDNLQKLRKAKNLKQEELAERAEVSITQISKIERNETDPRASTIGKLAATLGCSADKLLYGEEPESLDKMMSHALERAMRLKARDKATLINVINKYCSASVLIGTFMSEMDIDEEEEDISERMYQEHIEKLVQEEETARLVEKQEREQHNEL